jgi:hypothetical protein
LGAFRRCLPSREMPALSRWYALPCWYSRWCTHFHVGTHVGARTFTLVFTCRYPHFHYSLASALSALSHLYSPHYPRFRIGIHVGVRTPPTARYTIMALAVTRDGCRQAAMQRFRMHILLATPQQRNVMFAHIFLTLLGISTCTYTRSTTGMACHRLARASQR